MRDPYIREKFTRNLVFARELAREYFERYPKDRYETKVDGYGEVSAISDKVLLPDSQT
jgi:hypothetical protein